MHICSCLMAEQHQVRPIKFIAVCPLIFYYSIVKIVFAGGPLFPVLKTRFNFRIPYTSLLMNKMLYTALLAVLLPMVATAQIVYVDTTAASELRKTTTLFVVPEGDSVLEAAYEQAISIAWKFTPYKIVTFDEMTQYADKEGYSFFCELCAGQKPQHSGYDPIYTGPYNAVGAAGFGALIGVGIVASLIENSYDEKHLYRQSDEGDFFGEPMGYYSVYGFFMQEQNKHGKTYIKQYADIKMGLARGSEFYMARLKKKAKGNELDSIAPLAPDPYWNPHWNPGLLKTYLQIVSNDFITASGMRQFSNSADTQAVAHLATEPLYIPDYVVPLILRSAKQKDSSRLDSVIMQSYPFPYTIVTSRQLSDMLLTGAGPINFLTYSTYNEFDGMYNHAERKNEKGPFQASSMYRGIKVYNSEKGIIYARFPARLKFWGKTNGLNAFSIDDLADLADMVQTGRR